MLILGQTPPLTPSSAPEQGDGVDKSILIVRVHCDINIIACNHVLCTDSVEVVDIDLATAALNAEDTTLARLVGVACCYTLAKVNSVGNERKPTCAVVVEETVEASAVDQYVLRIDDSQTPCVCIRYSPVGCSIGEHWIMQTCHVWER